MLQATGIMVFYENMLAINNVSIRCKKGHIVGVFGANSAGKSTLMYTISGIMLDIKKKEEMAGGERITVLGELHYQREDIINLKPSKRARRGIVLCPERRRIFPESSVLENLKIGGYLATAAQVKETLEYVFSIFPSLERLKGREGGFLSGGEQQMLAIGRALMAQPKLLLLDEPLMGLSPAIQSTLIKAIKEIRDNREITIIVTEQYARPVLPIVDYAYILENGSAVLEGTGKEVMQNPDVKAAYFGM
jgi:branched-chain amino acid transport system ATP-binding protein